MKLKARLMSTSRVSRADSQAVTAWAPVAWMGKARSAFGAQAASTAFSEAWAGSGPSAP